VTIGVHGLLSFGFRTADFVCCCSRKSELSADMRGARLLFKIHGAILCCVWAPWYLDFVSAFGGTNNLRCFCRPQNVTVETISDPEAVGNGGKLESWWFEWPGTASEAPVLLYFHGGGFIAGHPRSFTTYFAALSRATGMRVCALHYALAPKNPLPQATKDAAAAYHHILKTKGVTADQVVLGGDSAGGGLVMLLLARLRAEQKTQAAAAAALPAAAFMLSPWQDLACASSSYTDNSDPLIVRRNAADWGMKAAGGDPVLLTSPTCTVLSPEAASLEGLPPLLFFVSTTEKLADDTTAIVAKAQDAGVSCSVVAKRDYFHIWPVFTALVPKESAEAIEQIRSFLTQHTAAAAGPAGSVSVVVDSAAPFPS
jgi:acetyl esterase/lipase